MSGLPTLAAATTAKTVAIIDDEEDIREACAIALEKRGYVVFRAEDAESFIEGMRTKRPEAISGCDRILMDYHLGRGKKRNGLDAAKEIRGFLPSAMITFVSSDDSIKGLVIGEGFQFIAKPFSMSKLLALWR